jgi:hypothetical protein
MRNESEKNIECDIFYLRLESTIFAIMRTQLSADNEPIKSGRSRCNLKIKGFKACLHTCDFARFTCLFLRLLHPIEAASNSAYTRIAGCRNTQETSFLVATVNILLLTIAFPDRLESCGVENPVKKKILTRPSMQ